MEPRFHTGDLALVRGASRYDVGDVVAYHSATLRQVVLHRVIGRRGDRYVVKGDHNDFVDPERPARDQVIGRLWVRVPRGGAVLGLLQSPLVAALLCGAVGLLLVAPARRRGRRRRGSRSSRSRSWGGAAVSMRRAPIDPDARLVLTGCAVLAGVCLLLGLVAWTRPATRTATEKVAYTQKVRFSYRADTPGGAVYPDGVVRTGDPIFLKLVDTVDVKVAYRLDTAARARLAGTQEVRVRLTGPSGWSRTLRLAPETAFSGTEATATVTLDLARLQDLIRRVAAATGTSPGVPFTVTVLPVVRVKGTVGGAALRTSYAPTLSFQLDPLQLRVGAGAATATATTTTAGDDGDAFAPSRRASVAAPTDAPNHVRALGWSIGVDPARWIALVGLLAAAALAVLTLAHRRRRPTDPYTMIRARYGHLIVPIASYVHDPAQPVVDVTSIDALAQVAVRGERVILHHHRVGAETYLVDDDGTLFRFQPRPQRLPDADADTDPVAAVAA
jgi:hypothetical protein